MTTRSYWMTRATRPKFPRLQRDLKVDVCVIGGGITGVTSAYLLKKAGLSVALLERYRCGSVDTGHTTAHLTFVTDARMHELVKRFGRDHARAAWDAGRAAIDRIQANIRAEKLECEFAVAPGYLHAPKAAVSKAENGKLQEDADLASEFGFDARYLKVTPFVGSPGVEFANQAKFQPLQYLSGLLANLSGKKCHVFEGTEVDEVVDEPLGVKAHGHTVACDYVVIATHVPLMGKTGLVSATLFQSKLTPYTSYAVAAKAPRDTVPEALFWDTSDPYNYLRVDRRPRNDYLVFGGEDHKTGQEEDTDAAFKRLEARLAGYCPTAKVTHRWSGQVIETHDGLPYIGETAERQFVATGFAGNGMTFGTLAGMMACDAALGRKNPWCDLFDVRRKKLGGAWDYIKENLDYPYYMVRDRLAAAEGESLRSLKRGQGKILSLNGERVAASRDSAGKVVTLSPVCTHMGCIIHWNPAESTWDCPCHGSRFKANGEVLAGPAEAPLEPAKVPAKS